MAIEPNKIIYSMIGVSKFYDKKPVLKDIYLSYFYGAKIGVLGLNGSGKSSLLRILAGVDKEFNGQTILSPGYTVGFLEQEPQLDDAKTVREIVEEGVQETVDSPEGIQRDQREIRRADVRRRDEQADRTTGQGAGEARHLDAWDLDSRLEMAMDALRCPPGRHAGQGPLRRRKAPGGPLPAAAAEAGHPASGRADQPPGRRIGRLAGAPSAALRRHGHRRHP